MPLATIVSATREIVPKSLIFLATLLAFLKKVQDSAMQFNHLTEI